MSIHPRYNDWRLVTSDSVRALCETDSPCSELHLRFTLSSGSPWVTVVSSNKDCLRRGNHTSGCCPPLPLLQKTWFLFGFPYGSHSFDSSAFQVGAARRFRLAVWLHHLSRACCCLLQTSKLSDRYVFNVKSHSLAWNTIREYRLVEVIF